MAVEQTLRAPTPEQTLLEILAQTVHGLRWWRRFGPERPKPGSSHELSIDPKVTTAQMVLDVAAVMQRSH